MVEMKISVLLPIFLFLLLRVVDLTTPSDEADRGFYPPYKKPPPFHKPPPHHKPLPEHKPPLGKPPPFHKPPFGRPPPFHKPPFGKPPPFYKPPYKKPPPEHKPPFKKPPPHGRCPGHPAVESSLLSEKSPSLEHELKPFEKPRLLVDSQPLGSHKPPTPKPPPSSHV